MGNVGQWLNAGAGAQQQNAWSDCHLEFFGGAERDLLTRLNLNLLACCRIAADAGSTVPHLQDPESSNLDALTIPQVLSDEADEILEHLLALLFGKLMLLRKSIGQVFAGDRLWSACHGGLLPMCVMGRNTKVLTSFRLFSTTMAEPDA